LTILVMHPRVAGHKEDSLDPFATRSSDPALTRYPTSSFICTRSGITGDQINSPPSREEGGDRA